MVSESVEQMNLLGLVYLLFKWKNSAYRLVNAAYQNLNVLASNLSLKVHPYFVDAAWKC